MILEEEEEEEEEILNFRCPICHSSFGSQAAVDAHFSITHTNIPQKRVSGSDHNDDDGGGKIRRNERSALFKISPVLAASDRRRARTTSAKNKGKASI
jgi:hypothetical protein